MGARIVDRPSFQEVLFAFVVCRIALFALPLLL
jgi:hypothetical protein